MEVACGEYGDMVPSLVVATRNGKCDKFQNLTKQVNCDDGAAATIGAVCTKVIMNSKGETCDTTVTCEVCLHKAMICNYTYTLTHIYYDIQMELLWCCSHLSVYSPQGHDMQPYTLTHIHMAYRWNHCINAITCGVCPH